MNKMIKKRKRILSGFSVCVVNRPYIKDIAYIQHLMLSVKI